MADWTQLLNTERRRPSAGKASARAEGRLEIERDYDRILFSTPVRRMADKTQLFPLEQHDAVHTRLTHSHEVSALARSVGIDLACRYAERLGISGNTDDLRNLSAVMAAVGLVHDIGNPPFGHEGERAIQRWFAARSTLEPKELGQGAPADKALLSDFLKWDGNAQTFRLIAHLQGRDEFGMNLTYATLSVALKYTVSASNTKNTDNAGLSKPGFFVSEAGIAADVFAKTGLQGGQRHPLSYLVEACDDIAYCVIDTEDTVRKGLASYEDLHDHLSQPRLQSDAVIVDVLQTTSRERAEMLEVVRERALSPTEVNAAAMQNFRVAAISALVRATLDTFIANLPSITDGTFKGDLLHASSAGGLRRALKEFLPRVAFSHRSVTEVELRGSTVITKLMDKLWLAIKECDGSPTSKPNDPATAYVYSRISENYRRAFEKGDPDLPPWYRRAQLLTDMIAGMTDSYALKLLGELERLS